MIPDIVAMAKMLSSCAYETQNAALDHYMESVYCSPQNTLIYVGTDPDEEQLAELAVHQPVRVIDARKEETGEVWI